LADRAQLEDCCASHQSSWPPAGAIQPHSAVGKLSGKPLERPLANRARGRARRSGPKSLLPPEGASRLLHKPERVQPAGLSAHHDARLRSCREEETKLGRARQAGWEYLTI